MKHEFNYVIWKLDKMGEEATADPHMSEPVEFSGTKEEAVEKAIGHAKERTEEWYPVIDCAGYSAILTDSEGSVIWTEKKMY